MPAATIHVTFHLADRSSRVVPIEVGSSLMEGARHHGVEGIVADCGGGAICGTCHVIVDPAWSESFDPPEMTERALIEFVPESSPTSRLSCQLVLREDHEGLEVNVPSEQLPL